MLYIMTFASLLLQAATAQDEVQADTYDPYALVSEAAEELRYAELNKHASLEDLNEMRHRISMMYLRLDFPKEAKTVLNSLEDRNLRDSAYVSFCRHYARTRQMREVYELLNELRPSDAVVNNHRALAVAAVVVECTERHDFPEALRIVKRFATEPQASVLEAGVASAATKVGDYTLTQRLMKRAEMDTRAKLAKELSIHATAAGRSTLAHEVLRVAESEVILAEPKSTRQLALRHLAEAYAHLKDFDSADRTLAAIQDRMLQSTAIVAVGTAFATTGETDRAVEVCRRLVRDFPGESPFGVLIALTSAGKYDEALDCALYVVQNDESRNYISAICDNRINAADVAGAWSAATRVPDLYDRCTSSLRVLESLRSVVSVPQADRMGQEIERLAVLLPGPDKLYVRSRLICIENKYGMSMKAKSKTQDLVVANNQVNVNANLARTPPISVELAVADALVSSGLIMEAIRRLDGLDDHRVSLWKSCILLDAKEYERAFEIALATHENELCREVLERAASEHQVAWAVMKARSLEEGWLRSNALYAIAFEIVTK